MTEPLPLNYSSLASGFGGDRVHMFCSRMKKQSSTKTTQQTVTQHTAHRHTVTQTHRRTDTNLSIVHDDDHVAGLDGVDAVGSGQHSAPNQVLLERLVNQHVGLAVNRRRRLVQHLRVVVFAPIPTTTATTAQTNSNNKNT